MFEFSPGMGHIFLLYCIPGRIMASKKILSSNPGSCGYINLYGKRCFADVIKLTNDLTLKSEDYIGLSG